MIHDELCPNAKGSCCPWMDECVCQCQCELIANVRADERTRAATSPAEDRRPQPEIGSVVKFADSGVLFFRRADGWVSELGDEFNSPVFSWRELLHAEAEDDDPLQVAYDAAGPAVVTVEPPLGSVVLDANGVAWLREAGAHTDVCWTSAEEAADRCRISRWRDLPHPVRALHLAAQ